MNIEDVLLIKINELTKLLESFNAESQSHLNSYMSLQNSEKEQKEIEKEMLSYYKKLRELQFRIDHTKSLLDTTISQLAFITSLNEKQDLTLEEQMKLQELSQIRGEPQSSFKQDYSSEEAKDIRTAFEGPRYSNDDSMKM